jgi:hypothetical protein
MRCEEDGEAGITAAEPLTLVVAEVIESCEISSGDYYIKDLRFAGSPWTPGMDLD